MNKNLYLNDRETESFYELLEVKKDLITMALYKVNIPRKLHHEFYNYGLEGLLVSFLILNEGRIEEKDFDRFAFTTIKRKLIDEIRYRNKDKSVPLDIFDNNKLDATDDNYSLVYIQLLEYLKDTLEEQELKFFCEFIKTLNMKQTAKAMNISLATAYRIHKRVKGVCEEFLLTK
ncbi:sigma-70 family RNA polymerase sigma factor [Gemella sp. 20925_1_85]|jgi:RNA polymerase sigma factor, sigma-70 family|uniref:sigma-70 family RNA polymerase sigma factor n=1 Tax=Gemella sp. 20925_1_85 TaxID=3003690 RepID=UPI00352C7043